MAAEAHNRTQPRPRVSRSDSGEPPPDRETVRPSNRSENPSRPRLSRPGSSDPPSEEFPASCQAPPSKESERQHLSSQIQLESTLQGKIDEDSPPSNKNRWHSSNWAVNRRFRIRKLPPNRIGVPHGTHSKIMLSEHDVKRSSGPVGEQHGAPINVK